MKYIFNFIRINNLKEISPFEAISKREYDIQEIEK